MSSYSNIFIISGPSGAGEDSIIEGLSHKMPLERIVTTTTREPRPGESQGMPYYFLSQEEFQKRLQNGEFVEYAQQYNGNFYGVTREELDRVAASGKIGIWKVEYQGVMTIKKLFPEIKAILITVASLDVLEQRIRRRDQHVSEEYIQERMEYTKEWLKHQDIYDYAVVNREGQLQVAIDEVSNIIRQNLPQEAMN
jgi:guanylate kinase